MGLSNLFTLIEYKYDLKGRIDYYLNVRKYRGLLGETGSLVEREFVRAVEDACDYLEIGVGDFFHLADGWSAMEEGLFNNMGEVNSFYRSWNEEYARANICANIISQHRDRVNFSVLSGVSSHDLAPDGRWVDYGCGTASLTIALILGEVFPGPVSLVEMDNDVLDFLKFRIEKHGLGSRVEVSTVDKFQGSEHCAMVYCVDVLEHLLDPSGTLMNRIDPLIPLGGLLYLKAPWRGQITHLDESPDNFYREGGRKMIAKNYEVVMRAHPMDMATVFRKVRKTFCGRE